MRRPSHELIFAIALAAATAALGCASMRADPIPDADPPFLASAAARGLDPDSVSRGHDLYLTSCGHCHSPVHPARRTTEEWSRVLPDMIRLSRLTPAQAGDVNAYIEAARSAPAPAR